MSTPNLSGTILMYMCTLVSQIVEHTEIDEHLEQIAENLILEHLIYTIFIATNNRTSGIFFHCVNSQTRLTIRDTRVGAYWFSAMLISKWPPGGHIGFCAFRTLTLVWLWLSTPNFSSEVTFKMVAWRPYCFFGFQTNLSLACIWVRAYWFSVTSFSK